MTVVGNSAIYIYRISVLVLSDLKPLPKTFEVFETSKV